MGSKSIRTIAATALAALLLPTGVSAQATFDEAFASIRDRPEFVHSFFGVEIYSIDRKKVLYAYNGDKLFQTGSTAKALTEGTSLELLGPDFRFHTPVYRTGPVVNGVLKGNILLVGSGDPNLSNRLQPDGTLAFADEDHSYGGFESRLLPGDPALPLAKLAEQIAGAGIKRIEGHILIDISLFDEGGREMGTGVVRSPVVVNDNVVDLVVSPGAENGPAILKPSLAIPYLRFVNLVTTGGKGSDTAFSRRETSLPDGTIEITLSGHIPSDKGSYVYPYPVASPSRFAAALFAARLADHGVSVVVPGGPKPAGDAFKSSYAPTNKLAEWVSAPLREDVKVTLQTSQNLHASTMPFVWGGILAPGAGPADYRGFALERAMLKKAGVDASGIVQANGEGSALFSPDFIARFLAFMAGRPTYQLYHDSLPVLGRRGTLKDILPDSPAAGHVFAKTGTHMGINPLADGLIVNAKALAGYTTTPSGENVAIAIYLNNVPIDASTSDPDAAREAIARVTGDTLGRIAAAAHLLPITAK
ncbi:D-alanyl-D-alanine carboxypeptidase/D-alanyl-D-alanine-endopeptidase [Sphingomonas sp. MMS24-J13]|uniref:D-alanyl-D-alanine carboxypeptidase/D-alanyl-D-alanine endopeptidase n=1 Tax=Sphingomonas sp. MMS24-J13 TaxID=3238686 RepID=UPI00384AEBEE